MEYQSKYVLKVVETNIPKIKIVSSEDVSDFIKFYYYKDNLEIYESFYLILLNNNNITLGFVKVGQGGITGCVVDVRLILKYVIDSLATGVILIHNHPSGKTMPSDADKKITDNILKSLNLISVSLIDHIIVTKESYFSFRNDGLI